MVPGVFTDSNPRKNKIGVIIMNRINEKGKLNKNAVIEVTRD